jgi:hypothetical protein
MPTEGSSLPAVALQPSVIFPSALSVSSSSDTPFTLTITDGKNVEVQIFGKNTGTRKNLQTTREPKDNLYQYLLHSSSLRADEYTLKVLVTHLNGSATSVFTGPNFKIEREETETTNSEPDSVKEESSLEQAVSNSDNSTTSTTVETASSVTMGFGADTVTSTEEIPTAPQNENVPLSATINNGEQLNQFRITILPTYTYQVIQLYVQAEQSTERLYLGRASKSTDGWYYWLDSTTLPAGSYVVHIEAFVQKKLVDSTRVSFSKPAIKTVAMPAPQPVPKTVEREPVVAPPVSIMLNRESTEDVENNNAPVPNPYIPPPSVVVNYFDPDNPEATEPPATTRARELLQTLEINFNDLLRRYGSSVQTDNPEITD